LGDALTIPDALGCELKNAGRGSQWRGVPSGVLLSAMSLAR
jgi:hypothetical protein